MTQPTGLSPWRARCVETVRRFTRRRIAPAGGRGSEGGDLGATRLTWTRKLEGTRAWRERMGCSGGVECIALQGPRDMAKLRREALCRIPDAGGNDSEGGS